MAVNHSGPLRRLVLGVSSAAQRALVARTLKTLQHLLKECAQLPQHKRVGVACCVLYCQQRVPTLSSCHSTRPSRVEVARCVLYCTALYCKQSVHSCHIATPSRVGVDCCVLYCKQSVQLPQHKTTQGLLCTVLHCTASKVRVATTQVHPGLEWTAVYCLYWKQSCCKRLGAERAGRSLLSLGRSREAREEA